MPLQLVKLDRIKQVREVSRKLLNSEDFNLEGHTATLERLHKEGRITAEQKDAVVDILMKQAETIKYLEQNPYATTVAYHASIGRAIHGTYYNIVWDRWGHFPKVTFYSRGWNHSSADIDEPGLRVNFYPSGEPYVQVYVSYDDDSWAEFVKTPGVLKAIGG